MNSDDYQPDERRPITSRDTKGAKVVASWIARRGVTPNAISVIGMFAGVFAGMALAATATRSEPAWIWWTVGAVLVQVRLLCNMFDGMVAVETNQASPVGELYNEVPDRVSDAATLIGLGYSAGSAVSLGYIAACLSVFVAYVRAMGKAAGGAQEFCGPMAKPQRMFLVTIAALYSAFAPATWPLSAKTDTGMSAAGWTLVLVSIGCVITSVRRLLRSAATLRKLHSK